MGFYSELFDGVLQELEDPSMSFNLGGTDYPCSVSRRSKGGKLEDYGYGVELDALLIARGELFTDAMAPTRGQTCTFDGETFAIDRVDIAPERVFFRLFLVSKTRGA